MSVPNTEAQYPTGTRVGRSHHPAPWDPDSPPEHVVVPERGPDRPEGSLDLTERSATVRQGDEAGLFELVASDFLPPPSWPTLQATLAELCLCLTEAVPSVESAGVVIFPPDSLLPGQRPTLDRAEVIGAAPVGAAVLQIERQLGEGPVLTACGLQSVVTSGDLSTDERWRRFGPAVADLQLHSVVAVPLPGINSVSAGVLSLYSPLRDAFYDRELHQIGAVADVVSNALLGAEMLERTRRAFEAMGEAWDRSRIVNQAVGVLIHWNCTEEQARSRLSRMASRANEDLAASARTIVDEARKDAHLSFIASRHSSRNSVQ